MSVDQDLRALADLNGILPSFYDLQGYQRHMTPDTQKALLAGNGIDVSSDAAIRDALGALRHSIDDRWFPEEIIVESGVEAPLNFGLGAEWHLRLDDTDTIAAQGERRDHITLPPLRSGIYELTAEASGRVEVVTVIAAPVRLPLIRSVTETDRLWGLNFALYGVRSERNSGLGDYEDLAQMACLAGAQGASFVGVNPIHNMGHSNTAAISPYSPSHRGFLNTSYIALDAIPGLKGSFGVAGLEPVKAVGTVQYTEHKKAHNAALERAHAVFATDASETARHGFEAFLSASGPALADFARFEALSETHGPDWRIWPAQTAVASPERIAFYTWLQWVAQTQLASAQTRALDAGMALGLYLDLAVGPRRDGAEAQCEHAAIAQGVSLGAPPDHLSPGGQNWDLAAFAPRKLKAQRYAPLRRILASTMQHAGIIRIDHVLGLNRSFWLPDDGSPGGYIRQSFDALLAVIKIEAERNNCVVIGEDLGLVPDGFRETMRDSGFYGYSVLQYEKDHSGTFPAPEDGQSQVLSCFATHDTPTVKGFETGRDIDWWQDLEWVDGDAVSDLRTSRAEDVGKLQDEEDFVAAIHRRLAQSNAGLVAVQLDDVLSSVEAQNLPGTIDEHPNWRRKYTVSVEELSEDGRLAGVATLMKQAGRASPRKGLSHED
ncbi:4-alpha-glucanotransferase [Tateyamaria pelophila]|uniref:4-alpha-glucanotransferase n=1 Tax=Tateyamaria pelophila TaxID=328415 RepID=UPI001CBB3A70|nr:4-alpha-glucanotransferase [Tateyamaria pelophila]